jgi:hypothetical protein
MHGLYLETCCFMYYLSAYYNLGLQQVLIADTPLVLEHNVFDSNFGTILDSGTTYAYFPDAAFNAFKSVVSTVSRVTEQ